MAAEMGEDLITCTICFEHFTFPKTLHCLHTFCEPCLQRHLEVYQSQRRALAGEYKSLPVSSHPN